MTSGTDSSRGAAGRGWLAMRQPRTQALRSDLQALAVPWANSFRALQPSRGERARQAPRAVRAVRQGHQATVGSTRCPSLWNKIGLCSNQAAGDAPLPRGPGAKQFGPGCGLTSRQMFLRQAGRPRWSALAHLPDGPPRSSNSRTRASDLRSGQPPLQLGCAKSLPSQRQYLQGSWPGGKGQLEPPALRLGHPPPARRRPRGRTRRGFRNQAGLRLSNQRAG